MWNAKQTGVLRVNGTNGKSSQLTDFLLLLKSSIGDWKKPAENWKPWALQIENDHFIANWSENANTKINKINFKIQLTTQCKKRIGLNYPASVQRRYLEKSQPHIRFLSDTRKRCMQNEFSLCPTQARLLLLDIKFRHYWAFLCQVQSQQNRLIRVTKHHSKQLVWV